MDESSAGYVQQITHFDTWPNHFGDLYQFLIHKQIAGFLRNFSVVRLLRLISDFYLFSFLLVAEHLFQGPESAVRGSTQLYEPIVCSPFEGFPQAVPQTFVDGVAVMIKSQRPDQGLPDYPVVNDLVVVRG